MARKRTLSQLIAISARATAYNDWAHKKFGASTREYNIANRRSSMLHGAVSREYTKHYAKGLSAG